MCPIIFASLFVFPLTLISDVLEVSKLAAFTRDESQLNAQFTQQENGNKNRQKGGFGVFVHSIASLL